MNEDLNYDTGNGLGRNAKMAIGIGAGVVLVAVTVGAVLFIRSRAKGNEPLTVSQSAVNGAVNGVVPEATNPKTAQEQMWDIELKAAREYNDANAAQTDDSGIKYGTEIKMTEDEKKLSGYADDADVRYKYEKLDTGGYVKTITKSPAPMPLKSQAIPTAKKPAPAQPVTAPAETVPATNTPGTPAP